MTKLTAGQTLEIKGFIMVSEHGFITFAVSEMPDYGYTTIMPHTITATVPTEFNPVAAEVSAIEKKLNAMASEYHSKAAQLKERIANLLCLENSPVEAPTEAPAEEEEEEWEGPF